MISCDSITPEPTPFINTGGHYALDKILAFQSFSSLGDLAHLPSFIHSTNVPQVPISTSVRGLVPGPVTPSLTLTYITHQPFMLETICAPPELGPQLFMLVP